MEPNEQHRQPPPRASQDREVIELLDDSGSDEERVVDKQSTDTETSSSKDDMRRKRQLAAAAAEKRQLGGVSSSSTAAVNNDNNTEELSATTAVAAANINSRPSSSSSSTHNSHKRSRVRDRNEKEEEESAKKRAVSSSFDATATVAASTAPPTPAAPIYLLCTRQDQQQRQANPSRSHWSWTQTKTLRELLGFDNPNNEASTRQVEWMVVGNYMIDIEYLLDQVPELLVAVPNLVLFYGYLSQPDEALDFWRNVARSHGHFVDFCHLDPSAKPNSPSNPTKQAIPYGVHHSKFFLVGYSLQGQSYLRVVIHTANLLEHDIELKAQGAYVQDFPLQKKSPNPYTQTQPPSSAVASDFADTLAAYLDTYHYRQNVQSWTTSRTGASGAAATAPSSLSPYQQKSSLSLSQLIRRYDFSTASVVLIPSAPGYHRISNGGASKTASTTTVRTRCGHLQLCRAIQKFTAASSSPTTTSFGPTRRSPPIVCQFSSIGSLNEKYLQQLQSSMMGLDGSTGKNTTAETGALRLQLVYPTVEEIRSSVEGYRGGGSVPGTTKNVSKPFLQSLYRKWSSSSSNRHNNNPLDKSRNVPHIKTYYQVHRDTEEEQPFPSMDWFVLSSHNMSSAAWGQVQNSRYGGKQLFVRHWELGVFTSPQLLQAQRLVPWSETASAGTPQQPSNHVSIATIPLPYPFLPEPYGQEDHPWAADVNRYRQADNFGCYSVQGP